MRLMPYHYRALALLLLWLLGAPVQAADLQPLYFNAQGEVVSAAQALYRRDYQTQGTQAQVHDFYYPSGKPYSNRYTIAAAKVAVFTPILHQGTLVLWHENGHKKMQGAFRQGRPDGTWLTWHTNGQLAASITYREGETEGVGMRWYANGQQESRLPFRHGQAHGRWQQWYASGQLKAEMEMSNGTPTIIRRWDEQGRLTAELSVDVSGQQSGVVLSWYHSGAKRSETVYQDDEVVAKTQWDEAGNELAE